LWDYATELSKTELHELVRRVLERESEPVVDARDDVSQGSDSQLSVSESGGETENAVAGIDLLGGRVCAVVRALVDQGEVEEVAGENREEQSDLKYKRVPPAPAPVAPRPEKSGRGVRAARLCDPTRDFGVMRPEYEERERQSVLEEKFDKFFADVVS
jgi:hypothetical protein